MALYGAVSVFVSSTCYDLADLRLELGQMLTENGFIVRLSEDVNSAFYVDPTDDSITSCLNNVEASDVVVCIIDRRYGGVLKDGPYKGISATHAEVKRARELNKPIFFFVRRVAYQEYDHMRKNGWDKFKTSWVEPDMGKDLNARRELWVGFVEEVASYPKHQNWSNWCDQYTTSVDLKPLVLKRLFDKFPKQATIQAIQPDRLVRLAFSFLGNHQSGIIRGYFQNVGVGPALDIVHGFRKDDAFTPLHRHGGLAVGAKLCESDQGLNYHTDDGQRNHRRFLYCSYKNAHGDLFRVETPVLWKGQMPTTPGPDRFFVGKVGIPELEWVQVG